MRLAHSSKYDVNVSEDTVIRELLKSGASMTNRGFSYIVDAILLIVEDDTRLHNVVKGVYREVATIRNVSPASVERCMRTAYQEPCTRNPEFLRKILPFNLDPRVHITLSEFLSYFYNHIINKVYDEMYEYKVKEIV